MLELRPTCENCNTPLPPESRDALICTFEWTFCKSCVDDILHNVCPNCGGGFYSRPIRPKKYLSKYPPSNKIIHKPVDMEAFKERLLKMKDIPPSKR